MRIKKIFLWVTVPIVGILLFVTVQMYMARGLQGRLKSAADDIGAQFSVGKTAMYEPYYMSSSYEAGRGSGQLGAVAQSIPQVRKLIKKAQFTVEVRDCQKAAQELSALVTHFSGIVLSAEIHTYNGNAKTVRMVFKIAPDRLDAALESIKGVGKVENASVTGDDVTEEYVDLQARLDNAKRVKERLLAVLEEKAHNVKDILEVERELGRVGQEIETMEGRMKYLDRQVDLSTVTVDYHEPVKAALGSIDISARFKATLHAAAEAFINVFNGMIIVLAVIFPVAIWGGVIGGGVKLGIIIFKKIRSSKK